MTEQKRERFSPPVLGGGSLLTVFAVLALTVFALLSLSTVRADVRLGDAAARAVTDYYAADVRAQEILAQLRNGGAPDGVGMALTIVDYADRSELIYGYAVPISDTQELQVEVRVDGENNWEVLRWQAVPAGEWEADEGMDLWDMELY